MPRRRPVHAANNVFASDSERSLLHLDGAQRKSTNRLTGCRVASMEVLLGHIKSLVMGIESDSFKYDENEGVFKMIEDITVGDTRTSTTECLLREFVECGSCYKRLKILIGRDRDADLERREHSYMFAVCLILYPTICPKILKFEFQVMCNAFEKYLETFRRTVIFVADTSIIQLSLRLAPMVKQMRNLAKVLSIHPSGWWTCKPFI